MEEILHSHSTDEDTQLEQEFQREVNANAVRNVKWGVLHTLYMYPGFIPLDFVVYPLFAPIFLWIRLAVVGVSVALHFLMDLPAFKRHAQFVGVVVYIYCSFAILAMIHIAEGYTSPYYAGINLLLIAFLVIIPLGVVRTGVVCLIIYSGYIIPILIAGNITNIAVFVANNFFLVSTMLFVSVSSYLDTKIRKREFVSRFRLSHANEELRELDILKSQFFANISHEIRTPLTSIMAPIQSLYSGDVGALTPFQRDLVGQVYRNSIRLLDLVNQMLDFAKFDAKKMQLRLKRINLESIVREHVTLFQEVAVRKNLTLGYQVTGAVPFVYLDVDKVERILSNLIRNAIKFTEKGSIVVELSRQENEIVIKVRDTGIGIAKNQLPRIFERFQQVDGSSTRKYEGTGLGLTIVREAVELQHGRIRADSSEHVGTTITVSIPMDLELREPEALSDRRQEDRRQADQDFPGPDRRSGARRREDYTGLTVEDIVFLEAASLDQAAAASNSDDISDNEPPRSGGLKVLYVEDSADLRNYVRQMLRTFGHQVFTANDGLEGWEKALEVGPDVVVSDVMMPRLDGFELLKRIKTDQTTYHIPVVLITAKSETDSKIAGLEIGADDYLSKPIDIRELDARIRNLITTKQFQQALTRAKELEARVEELSMSFSRSLELRDSYTAGHSTDVLTYGVLISQMLGIETSRELKEALLLHDIGKIGIPDHILQKTEGLSDEEWEVMRRHPELGEQLLGDFESFRSVGNIIAAHHERYDGKGYPRGIAGDDIPIEARIVAVADSWHAMREDRAYRRALPPEVAVAELVSNRGKQFDPKVVDAFLEGLVAQGFISRDIIPRVV